MSDSYAARSSSAADHPLHLTSTDDLRRSRLTVFFRILLAIPHLIVLYVWTIGAEIAVVIAWFAGILLGRVPPGLHNFIAGYWRYRTRVTAYVLLLADPYPAFGSGPPYPIDLIVAPAATQNRLTILFRIILAIPAAIVANVLQNVAGIVAILAWFYALFTGKANKGMRDLQAYCLRYQAQTHGYLLLLTQRYPSFSDD